MTLTYNYIKQQIEYVNYKLLSTEYINSRTKLKIQCYNNHIFEMTWHDFQQGNRCPKCYNEKRGQKQCLKYNDVKNYIESFDYKLLSSEYKNAHSKLKLQCPEGHVFEMGFNNFKQGQRCPECYNKTRGKTQRLLLKHIKSYIEQFNYELLTTEYINIYQKLKLQCTEGHVFEMRFNDFQQDHRCPKCSYTDGKSKQEKKIVEYIKTIYSGIILENDRSICKNYWTGKNLELDIFLPTLNKAIEFNGEYWHSFDDTKWKDEMKKKQCDQKGIDLLVIQEQNWINDKECCLNTLIKGWIMK